METVGAIANPLVDASVSGLHGIGLVSDDTANRVKENLVYDRAQRAKFFSQLPTNFLTPTKESLNKMLELPRNLVDPSKTWRDVADSTKGTLNIAGTVYGGVKLAGGLAKAGTSFVKTSTSIFDNMGLQPATVGGYGSNISGWGNIKAATSSAGKDVGMASLMNMSKLKPTSPISKSKPANSASTNLNKTKGLVDEGTSSSVKAFGPINKGPLPDAVANTFRSGTYSEIVTQGEITLYRAYGGKAGKLGNYWTTTKPKGSLQSIIDSALDQNWGNTATNISTIKVPKGTTIYQGYAAQQGSLVGGGVQVYMPEVNPSWLLK